MCGRNAAQFPGLHFLLLCPFRFSSTLVVMLDFGVMTIKEAPEKVNFMMGSTEQSRKYEILLLSFLVSLPDLVCCSSEIMITTYA